MFDNSFSGSVGIGGYTVVFGPSYPSYPSYPPYPVYTPPPSGIGVGFGMDGTIVAVLLLVGVLLFLK
jgi:hypothetical protein